MCHDNEEWCKIWRGIDLSFQNWYKEFDKFLPEYLKVSKIFTWMGFSRAKYILLELELKKYRGGIFHEPEEGYKVWRGIDLSFQNWHKEFDTFWPEHSKVSKTCVLIGFLWPKYILFELQKYWGLSWHWRVYKFWRKIDLWFAKRHEKFGKFSPEHLKVSKLGLWWDPFV